MSGLLAGALRTGAPDYQPPVRGGDPMQNLQGSRLAAELDWRLAGAESLTDVVAWWRGEWRAAALNGEDILPSELNETDIRHRRY
jgi:hypothetical protein